MGDLLGAAREGFVYSFQCAATVSKVFLIWIPCFVVLSIPAYLLGYAWCWVCVGFRLGMLTFEQTTEDKTKKAVFWRFDITEPMPDERR